jgi:hypothetical protein
MTISMNDDLSIFDAFDISETIEQLKNTAQIRTLRTISISFQWSDFKKSLNHCFAYIK